jgi:hypothetical protein
MSTESKARKFIDRKDLYSMVQTWDALKALDIQHNETLDDAIYKIWEIREKDLPEHPYAAMNKVIKVLTEMKKKL